MICVSMNSYNYYSHLIRNETTLTASTKHFQLENGLWGSVLHTSSRVLGGTVAASAFVTEREWNAYGMWDIVDGVKQPGSEELIAMLQRWIDKNKDELF